MRPGLPEKLALGAVALLLGAASIGLAPARAPRGERQLELRRAVERLALDGAAEPGEAPGPARGGERGRTSGSAPQVARGLWPRLAALAFGAGGWPAVFGLQWLLVAGGVALGARATAGRVGSAAAYRLAAVALGASAAALATLHLVPEALAFAAVVAAGAVVWGRRSAPTVEPEQVYGGDLERSPGAARWLVAGALLGVAATVGPSYLALALPFVAAAGAGRRAAAAASLVLGGGVAFGAAALAAGWPWPSLTLAIDPRGLGWGALALLVGRTIGVLPSYLAFGLAAAAPARDEGRGWIGGALALAAIGQLVSAPFDLAGDSGAPGNGWFLPLAGLLFFLPARVPGTGACLATAALSLALVLPPALSTLGGPGFGGPPVRSLERARQRLPLETTERDLPGAATLDPGSGIVVRGAEPELFAGRDGRLRLATRIASLAIESATPLASLRLEFGADAPATFEVEGAGAGNVVLRPNGDLALDLAFDEPSRSHPTWRSPRGASIYLVRLVLERPPVAPLAFDFSLARPASEPDPGGDVGGEPAP